MSYRKLDIWKLARELVIDVHRMTLEQLPKLEMYEIGSQIRRSVKSIRSNIVEGYGRRYYKQELIRFIIYAIASTDETVNHLETLFETGSLKDEQIFNDLHNRLEVLGKKLNNFLNSVEQGHISKK